MRVAAPMTMPVAGVGASISAVCRVAAPVAAVGADGATVTMAGIGAGLAVAHGLRAVTSVQIAVARRLAVAYRGRRGVRH